MTKLNVLLLLALVASALMLVKTAYEARHLFTEIHRAENEGQRLAGDHTRLEADRQQQATNLRVERTARERLKMATVTPAITLYEARVASAPATATTGARR